MSDTLRGVESGPADATPAEEGPARPVMDPRIRQRRTAVIRHRGRRRLRVAVALSIVVAVPLLALGALHSGLFSARHVTVRGAAHTPVHSVLSVSGLAGHPALIDVDGAAAARLVERLPWVGTAVVERHWPDSVTVVVTERVPAAAVAVAGRGVALVDATGRVLTWASSDTALPALVASGRPGAPGTTLGRAFRPGLDALGALPGGLRGQVHTVAVGGNGQVTVDLAGGVTAVLGPAQDLGAKFEALVSVLDAEPPKGPEVIDVTVPGAPVVGPVAAHVAAAPPAHPAAA